MNAPQSPGGPASSPEEQDPTGVRDLLASLPDPGPMPAELSARIEASLAQEQQARAAAPADVTPFVGRPVAPGARGATAMSANERTRRRRWLTPVAGLGAAAAIAIGTLTALGAFSSDQEAPPANAVSSSSPGPSGLSSDRISILNSGKAYTAAGLSTEAVALKSQTGIIDPTRAESSTLGPAATTTGLLDCLKTVGPQLVTADHIAADFGRYQGKPAVIVVITTGGTSNAWVFNRTCTSAHDKIAGPARVA